MIEFREMRLGEIFDIEDGDRGVNYPKQNEFLDEGYCLFLNAGNVTQRGFLFSDNQFITIEKDQRLRKGKLRRNDIVVTTRGTVGNVAYYDSSVEYDNIRINSGMVILRNHKGVSNTRYLYQYLRSPIVQSLIKLYSSGSAQPQLPIKDLKRIKLSLPNLEVQNSIANALSAYDDLIENNNRRIALLEKAAQELYKEWFVRFRFPGYEMATFENGLPKGWVTKKLFDIANVKYGYAFKSDLFCEDETLNPVVRIRDIPNNKTNTFTSEECDEKYIINENAIVIGMDGIFHMCLWNGGKAFLNQRVVEIESKIEYLSNLYLYYALYPQVKYWEQTISGTTVAHLGDKHLKKMTVIMPNEEIAQKATAIFNEIMIQKNILFKQNQNLIKQRDLLLPRLMSGKMEV